MSQQIAKLIRLKKNMEKNRSKIMHKYEENKKYSKTIHAINRTKNNTGNQQNKKYTRYQQPLSVLF